MKLFGYFPWKKSFILIPIFLICSFHSLLAMDGVPHFIYGKVLNSDGNIPERNSLEAHAYIYSRPEEILNQSEVGCGYDLLPDGGWLWFEAGNFLIPWSINETLRVIVIDNHRLETAAVDLVLDGFGNQHISNIVLTYGDKVGPLASNGSVQGDNPASIPQGKKNITLAGKIDDSITGNNSIQKAEYFIDTDPGFGSGIAMTSKNGSFDNPQEEVNALIDSSSWKQGSTYKIYFRGQDIAENWGTTSMVVVSVTTPERARGDIDGDGDVDNDDLNIVLRYRNQPVTVCPECDLDGDGMITALDSRILVSLCTRPRCAIH
jgi:hypothetical protein